MKNKKKRPSKKKTTKKVGRVGAKKYKISSKLKEKIKRKRSKTKYGGSVNRRTVRKGFCEKCGFEKTWACPDHGCGSFERVGEKKSEIKVSSRRIRR